MNTVAAKAARRVEYLRKVQRKVLRLAIKERRERDTAETERIRRSNRKVRRHLKNKGYYIYQLYQKNQPISKDAYDMFQNAILLPDDYDLKKLFINYTPLPKDPTAVELEELEAKQDSSSSGRRGRQPRPS